MLHNAYTAAALILTLAASAGSCVRLQGLDGRDPFPISFPHPAAECQLLVAGFQEGEAAVDDAERPSLDDEPKPVPIADDLLVVTPQDDAVPVVEPPSPDVRVEPVAAPPSPEHSLELKPGAREFLAKETWPRRPADIDEACEQAELEKLREAYRDLYRTNCGPGKDPRPLVAELERAAEAADAGGCRRWARLLAAEEAAIESGWIGLATSLTDRRAHEFQFASKKWKDEYVSVYLTEHACWRQWRGHGGEADRDQFFGYWEAFAVAASLRAGRPQGLPNSYDWDFTTPDRMAKIVAGLLERADRLANCGHPEAGDYLLTVVQDARRRAKPIPVPPEIVAQLDTAEQAYRAKRARQEYDSAMQVLAAEPGSERHNRIAGEYLCFVLEQWPEGLPRLAGGGINDLADAATSEEALRGSSDGQAYRGVADMWKKLAGKIHYRPFAQAIRRHAGTLYTLAATFMTDPVDRQICENLARECKQQQAAPAPNPAVDQDPIEGRWIWRNGARAPITVTFLGGGATAERPDTRWKFIRNEPLGRRYTISWGPWDNSVLLTFDGSLTGRLDDGTPLRGTRAP